MRYLTLLLLLAPSLLGCDQLRRDATPPAERPPADFGILIRDESPLFDPARDCLASGRAMDFLLHTTGQEPGYYAWSVGEIDEMKSDVLFRGYSHTGEGWTGVGCSYLWPGVNIYFYFKRTADPAEDWWVARRTLQATFRPDGAYRVAFTPATIYREPVGRVFMSNRLDPDGRPKLDAVRRGYFVNVHGPYCLQAGAPWFLGRPMNSRERSDNFSTPAPPAPPAAYVAVGANGLAWIRVFVDGRFLFGTNTSPDLTFALSPRDEPYRVVFLQTGNNFPETGRNYRWSYIVWGLVEVREGPDGRAVCGQTEWKWVEMPYTERLPYDLLSPENRRYDPFSWEGGVPPWQR
ncbi:hypothetical protein DV704_09840 [Meiothermus sp. QL-1]|uniref:hypothetical protein n=1 Tax=Meiothermus sp. QL-1 TaxID=2058095 RepID=UPI000E0C4485|nr:hypothetical protein [Meiothermus sp. QL-1]RDI94951.1 hypothetical protein DV704_09840 [Meiothermus sp. QL-1]